MEKLLPASSGGSNSSKALWRQAGEGVFDDASHGGSLERLAEQGQLDDVAGLACAARAALERADRSTAPVAALQLAGDAAACLVVVLGLAGGLQPLGLMLAVGAWAAWRAVLLRASAAAAAVRDVGRAVDELQAAAGHVGTALRMEAATNTEVSKLQRCTAAQLLRTLRFVDAHPHPLLSAGAWKRFAAEQARGLRLHRDLARAVAQEVQGRCSASPCVAKGRWCSNVPAPALVAGWLDDHVDAALVAIEQALRPRQIRSDDEPPRCFALVGLGGVGKSCLARRYAALYRRQYSATLWVNAESLITAGRSFREIARLLGIKEVQDTTSVILQVENRMINLDQPWLIIFDGANNLNVLHHVWPADARCSVLITTRDHIGMRTLGLDEKVFQLQPLDDAASARYLLENTGVNRPTSADHKDAMLVTSRIGGLPLALNQICAFMAERKFSLRDFLLTYKHDAEEINGLAATTADTVNTRSIEDLWEGIFSGFSEETLIYTNVLAFLGSEHVSDEVLERGVARLDSRFHHLAFLYDLMGRSEAEVPLLRWGLLVRDCKTNNASLVPLAKEAAIRRLHGTERRYWTEVVGEITRLGTDGGEVAEKAAMARNCTPSETVPGAPHKLCKELLSISKKPENLVVQLPLNPSRDLAGV